MNPCLKTGADVLIESHQAVLHGDLYICGEMFILRYLHGETHEPNYQYDSLRINSSHATFFNATCDRCDHQMPWASPETLHLDGAGVWMIHRDHVVLNLDLQGLLGAQEAYRKYVIA